MIRKPSTINDTRCSQCYTKHSSSINTSDQDGSTFVIGRESMVPTDGVDPSDDVRDVDSETEESSVARGETKIGATTRFVELLATIGSFLLVLVTLPFSLCFTFKVVQEYERAVVFRMGRLKGAAYGPGTFFVMPCVDNCVRVDLRTVSFDVPPQEVLTKDSVTVSVDAVVYYRIKEPLNAVIKIANYSHSTRLLAASTLRTVLGTRNLAEILSERETISHTMQTSLDEATEPWGVKVERVEIKDVRLPVQLQRAMATEAEAAREARAKVIAAEGEMLASRALKEASDVISTSPAALQLRYLQTLSNISAEKNSTIIFPLPVEFLTPFFNRGLSSQIEGQGNGIGTESGEQGCADRLTTRPHVHSNGNMPAK